MELTKIPNAIPYLGRLLPSSTLGSNSLNPEATLGFTVGVPSPGGRDERSARGDEVTARRSEDIGIGALSPVTPLWWFSMCAL